MTKWSRRTPCLSNTTPGNARRSHRAVIARGSILARPLRKSLPCFAEAPSEAEGGVEGVGTTLIAQWAFAFHAACAPNERAQDKDPTSSRVKWCLTMPAVRRATSQKAWEVPHPSFLVSRLRTTSLLLTRLYGHPSEYSRRTTSLAELSSQLLLSAAQH